MRIRSVADALSAVLFPAPCRICGGLLTTANLIPVCDSCLGSFQSIGPPMCQCCGRPFVSPVAAQAAQPLCRLCRTGAYAFDQARSYGAYDNALSSAVVLLKYEGVKRLGDWFAGRLAELVKGYAEEWRVDMVIPVPLHAGRLRERGYNQAELIAKPLAKKLGLPFGSYLLVRTKPRPAQLILSRSERWTSVRGAYATRPGARVDNLRILLVDDVLTTGATLDACSRALRRGGAAAVFAATVARVVPGWSRAGAVAQQPTETSETVPADPASL